MVKEDGSALRFRALEIEIMEAGLGHRRGMSSEGGSCAMVMEITDNRRRNWSMVRWRRRGEKGFGVLELEYVGNRCLY